MKQQPIVLLRRLNPYLAKALEAAAALCQARGHSEISIEHWLLKILELGDSDITVIARRYELDMDSVWQALLNSIEQLPRTIRANQPQLSAHLFKILQNAWLAASLNEQASQIRSIHLLSTLVEQPELLRCDGCWPLLSISPIQLERLRPLLDQQSEERSEVQLLQPLDNPDVLLTQQKGSDGMPAAAVSDTLLAVLNKFTQDITAKARAGQIDPVFGRDDEVRQMVDILSRRRKNNPILVGEPGVGKTALVEGLALRIAEGKVPVSLKSIHLRTLDLGLLQAGAGVKGEFEQRLKNVIQAVQQSPDPVLLFIDEAHTIIGAGNQAGGADAANLLKPALARGELRTIAATTWSEYKQYFERDAALERRFQMIKVDEPDDATACLMLRGLKERYASFHGVQVSDAAVKAAVSLSRRYLTGRQLPDKAVDLLDTACARVRISLDTEPAQLAELRSRIAALELEHHALSEEATFGGTAHSQRLNEISNVIAQLNSELLQTSEQFEQEKALVQQLLTSRQSSAERTQSIALQQQLEQLQSGTVLISPDVDVRCVANVIADWTGIPLSNILKDEQRNLLTLENQLSQRVMGQSAALYQLAQHVRAAKTGLTNEQAPLGVFLLVGSSGVGKTETALALADSLFGGEKSLITINLSEYQEAHTVSQLKGSPPGYVGYGQGGVLTEAIRKRPYSVLLLDEVEKAHRDVLNLFYQVFDRGVMRDGEGREIDFRNCLIVMTSNLGSDQLMAHLQQHPDASDSQLHELIRPVLRDHFQPALLARIQSLIYRPLDAVAMRSIVEIKLNKVVKRLQQHYGIRSVVQPELYDSLVDACLLPDTGARNIDSLLNQHILPVISQQLLLRQGQPEQIVSCMLLGYNEEDGISLEFIPASGIRNVVAEAGEVLA